MMPSLPSDPAPETGVERTIRLDNLWRRVWARRRPVGLLLVAGLRALLRGLGV